MTVRVNKSSFNIREKLSELGRKFGLKGSELAAAETVQEARDLISAGRKNKVINGDFKVWQRGTSGSSGSGGSRIYHSADRWFKFNNADSTSQLDLSSENIGGITGRYRYGMRVSGTQSSRILGQCIEGPLPAGDYVFSAWVRFSEIPINFYMTHNSTALTGENNFAGWYGGSGTAISYTKPDNVNEVSKTGVWYHVYKRFTAVSPHLGLGIAFQPVFAASTTATMDITGVQVELGKNATDFENRSYGEELALCQRYYEKHEWTASQYIGASIQHGTTSSTSSRFIFPYLTRKRTTDPSFTATGTYLGYPPNESVTLTSGEDNDTAVRVNVSRTTSYAGGTGILILSSGAGNYFEIEDEL